jgi:hypothetical protein
MLTAEIRRNMDGTEIAYQNKDITSKMPAENFKGKHSAIRTGSAGDSTGASHQSPGCKGE